MVGTLAIGFPLVENVTNGAKPHVVAAFMAESSLNGAQNTVSILWNVQEPRETTLEKLFDNAVFKTFDAGLKGGDRKLLLHLEADEDSEFLARSLLENGSVEGYSATLALHLVQCFRFPTDFNRQQPRVLVSVKCTPSQISEQHTVVPLSGTAKGNAGLNAKWEYVQSQASVAHALVVTDSDTTFLQPLGAAEVPSDIVESLRSAVGGNQLWRLPPDSVESSLVEELGKRLGLDALHRGGSEEYQQRVEPAKVKAEARKTTRDLLVAAIAGENDWCKRALEALRDGTHDIVEGILGSALLDIQEQALRDPSVFGCACNVIVSGPTGSGKSRLMDAFILHTILVEQKMCIYVAPTRALAGQFHRQFINRYGALVASATGMSAEREIVLSTGEEGRHDAAIRSGQVRLACMVTEKVNVLMSVAGSHLGSANDGDTDLGLVILDEMHMIGNPSRGGVVDLLLSKVVPDSNSDASPRVLGISTEDVDELIADRKVLVRNGLPPVSLKTDVRPVHVRHIALISGGRTEVEITNFSKASARFLDETALRAKAKALAKDAASEAPKYKNLVDHREYLRKLINRKLCDFSLVIFAYGSYGELLEIGDRLSRDRSTRKSTSDDVSYEQALADGDLTDSARKRLAKWALKDIYLHTSNQDADVRAWIEDTFGRPLPSDRKVIILTTETLTYGVNLCADCVILGGTSFPRDTDGRPPPDGDVPRESLSSNEFHNLLGRAGRYGLEKVDAESSRPVAEAIFIVDRIDYSRAIRAAVAPKEESLLKELKRYYVRPIRREGLFSGLLRREDLEIHRKHAASAERGHVPPELKSNSRLSFAALRTVCDVVRHRRTSTKEQLFEHLHEKTLFYGIEGLQRLTLADRAKHAERVDAAEKTSGADAVFSAVLEAASDKSSPLRLLEFDADAKTYAITAKAEALIDTGTRPWAIETIASWLEKLRALFPSSDEPPPCDLLVFGFVATPEFWNMAAPELCEEATKSQRVEKEDGDKWKANQLSSLAMLQAELIHLGLNQPAIEALLPEVVQFLGGQMARGDRYLSFQSHHLRLSAYFKLTAIVFMWLRGGSVEDIMNSYAMLDQHGASTKKRSGADTLQSKFTGRLRWQAQATFKFFGGESWFFPKFQRDLGDFAARLGMGIPAAGLPLIFGKGRKRQKRRDVVAAISSGETPGALLRGGVSGSAAGFSAAVLDYYGSELEQLLGSPGKGGVLAKNVGAQWEELKATAARNLRPSFASGDFVPALLAWLSECWIRCEPLRDGCYLNAQQRTISVAVAAGAPLIFQLVETASMAAVQPARVPLVILEASEVIAAPARGIAVSQVGSIVLLDLFLRGFVRSDQLVKATHLPRAIFIRDLVLEFCDRVALGRAGPLQESLLAFDEPGARP